ncbi:hypothetical protein [Arthrobacter sp. Bi83]|uniref:hypothetical protein n=1 Tax=Arthrobacter sp. Bi83 TaxID=2822353 RepID=UPI001E495440|nr:hypothetical protein [Arthrobacter sp. Bi83]
MRAIDLEARVISAVDQLRAGQNVEHDLIECKRSWPQEKKARQLAGSLNRAGGDPVIYIIGIDEKTGAVHDVSDTDILDWWSQIVPQFDHTPPELVRHLNVQVGEGRDHVVALAVASDRAPYVVKTGSANPSLEVPMREGTGTRSARRDELLRMLIPAVRLPQVLVLHVGLRADYYPETPRGNEARVHVGGQMRLYVEHNDVNIVTLPAHGMRGRLTVGNEKFDIAVSPPQEEGSVPTGQTHFRFQRPSDGVVLRAPRAVPLGLTVAGIKLEHVRLFNSAAELKVDVALEVLHAKKSLRVQAVLNRDSDSNVGQQGVVDGVYTNSFSPGNWSFRHGISPFDD